MKGRGTKELEQLKHLNLKIWEAATKNVAITEKKKTVCQRNHIYQPGASTKVTLDIDFTDEPVVQYDVPVVENTFVDD